VLKKIREQWALWRLRKRLERQTGWTITELGCGWLHCTEAERQALILQHEFDIHRNRHGLNPTSPQRQFLKAQYEDAVAIGEVTAEFLMARPDIR
jgi:hypothetical protein